MSIYYMTGLSKDRKSHVHVRRIVETITCFQSTDFLDVLLGQVEICHVEVLFQSMLAVALWNDSQTALRSPPQEDLCAILAVFLSNCDNRRVFKQVGCSVGLGRAKF